VDGGDFVETRKELGARNPRLPLVGRILHSLVGCGNQIFYFRVTPP
jgi:hypothetical protein